MGGGNAQKSASKREKNAAKAKAASGNSSQLASNKKAMTNVCSVCRQSFMCTMSETGLRQHVDNKHSGKSFQECFPTFQPA
mmetsp:Transcript_606/g.1098  ORF Transcript_606/g.1098 Transcript_606/m.1098 type:complete len:81 (+) Transcript_606:67-309(+)